MSGAGDYPDRLRRLVRSVTKDAVGQDKETFTQGAWLWCRVEVVSGRRQQDYGATQTGADVTVYVRNAPTLSPLDRLTDGETVYVLDTVRIGDNELVCEANYYDELTV